MVSVKLRYSNNHLIQETTYLMYPISEWKININCLVKGPDSLDCPDCIDIDGEEVMVGLNSLTSNQNTCALDEV